MFRVTFSKTMTDSNGHSHQVQQGIIGVLRSDADCTPEITRESALEIAKFVFARVHKIPSWEHHADDVAIEDRSAPPEWIIRVG
jgi:hypothetical protein